MKSVCLEDIIEENSFITQTTNWEIRYGSLASKHNKLSEIFLVFTEDECPD